MQRPVLTSTLFIRAGLTLIIWMLALATLTACSTMTVKKEPEPTKPAVKQSANEKKQKFFAFMKPHIESENQRIAIQREKLLRLQKKHSLSGSDLKWLQALGNEYKISIKQQPDKAEWQKLVKRVDAIPLEMALIQAANESAWGTSRFARKGNNYFGQWCYTKGCGLVPKQRAAGATHEVRRFSDARESVNAYMRNINTTRAYADFRSLRQISRNKGHDLNAEKLAVGLKSYSERGMAYVKIIQSMIRSNRELIASS
ncbi:Bax protein [Mariprofundus micogutta]|uniref:Bax protein n=1 Tax=Mariprofundus micogutta TaxID=1921010 RepID=A0A1L8CLC3_9PROT|nr:glucosaminidase domain-containing protein [Mariprofundus micogutta]GAV19639.1 Bax protein [Mariprofundus micogutta]